MRTALLAALKTTDGGDLRAFLTLAGRSVIAWQIACARETGCERIICLCEGANAELIELQREVEAGGIEFHAIRSLVQLTVLLRTDDDLIMLLDGLFVEPSVIKDLVKNDKGSRIRQRVITLGQDDELVTQMPDDFERIDASRHWAGVAVVHSATAQKLSDCPPDGDAMSLLLRLALQTGVPCEPMRQSEPDAVGVLLSVSQDVLNERQRALIEAISEPLVWTAPFQAIGSLLAKKFALSGIEQVREFGLGSAGLLMAIGIACAWLGFGAVGIFASALGVFCGTLVTRWCSLRLRLFGDQGSSRFNRICNLVLDLGAIATLIGALNPTLEGIAIAALPAFAVGLARLGAVGGNKAIRAFWSDRTCHLMIFGFAAIAGALAPVLSIFGLLVLADKLLHQQENSANSGLTITR